MQDGSGSVPPFYALARLLTSRGHSVTFAGNDSQRAAITAKRRSTFLPLRDPFATSFDSWIQNQVANPGHLQEIPALVAQGYDRVLCDFMMTGALAALETLKRPQDISVLGHTTIAAAEGLMPLIKGKVNAVRKQAGLDPVQTYLDVWTRASHQQLIASLPELEPNAGRLPSSVRYIGPQIEPFDTPADLIWPWPADDARHLVLPGFSSVPAPFGLDQRSRIKRTLAALGESGKYRLLLTTSVTPVNGLKVPGDALVLPYVSHAWVLSTHKVAAVVCHAGHGTVSTALNYGVPPVCLPNPASDQPAVADGAALAKAAISDAVEQVITRPEYKAAAVRCETSAKQAQEKFEADLLTMTEMAWAVS